MNLMSWSRRQPGGENLSPLPPDRVSGLMGLCSTDPVQAVLLAHQVQRWGGWARGDVVVVGDHAAPVAAAWATGAVMPFCLAARPGTGYNGVVASVLEELAQHVRPRLSQRGSVVGPAEDVAALWAHLHGLGVAAREERWDQPVLCAPPAPGPQGLRDVWLRRRPALAWVAHSLHAATRQEGELVLPASVAMFTDEVGYDPTASGPGYARHVGWLVASGRSYIVLDDGAGGPARPGSPGVVAFKADVGALWSPPSGGVAQITGVWTRPDLRGRGVGSVAMAAVVDAVRRDHVGPQGTVSLYVNGFNTAALALYRSVGFNQVGTYATVLL